jgi:hypothetical protein
MEYFRSKKMVHKGMLFGGSDAWKRDEGDFIGLIFLRDTASRCWGSDTRKFEKLPRAVSSFAMRHDASNCS